MLVPLVLALAPLQTCATDVAVTPFGLGTPGATGVPRLNNAGAPVVGGPYFVFVSDALPDAPGLVQFGLDRAELPLPAFGGQLLVGAPLVTMPFTVDADGFSGPLAPIQVPPGFCGARIVAQAAVFDAAAVGGLALTAGLDLEFGSFEGRLFSGRMFGTIADGSEIELVDLDGDGDLDVVVGSRAPSGGTLGGVNLLFNAGDGVLDIEQGYLGTGISGIAAGDLDADGLLDLFAVARNGTTLHALRGLPDGTWQPVLMLPTGFDARDVEVGDLDDDGDLDVVVAGFANDRLELFLGNADGSLTPAAMLPVGPGPEQVAIVDLDGDGTTDLVSVDRFGGVSLLRGLGLGAFAPASTVSMGSGSLLAGVFEDLDGDGHRDVAVGKSTDQIAVRFGEGAGVFAPLLEISVTGDALDLDVGDLDGDGRLDLVTVADFPSGATVVRGGPGVSFLEPLRFDSVGLPTGVAVGDLDDNGVGDCAVVSDLASAIAVQLEVEAELSGPPTQVDKGDNGQGAIVRGYFDGDGTPDLLVSSIGLASVSFLRGLGAGIFEAPVVIPVPTSAQGLAAGDVDGDGDLDAVVGGGELFQPFGLQLLLNGGNGDFALTPLFLTSSIPLRIELVDLDGDDSPEIVAAGLGGTIDVLDVDPSGQLTSLALLPIPDIQVNALQVADLDADGELDIVVGQDFQIVVLRGLGGLAFEPFAALPGIGSTSDFSLSDLDGDGVLDLAYAPAPTAALQVALGTGQGDFAPAIGYGDGSGGRLVVQDLDGDGDADVVGLRPGELRVFLNDGAGALDDNAVFAASDTALDGLMVGDLDEDGTPDVSWSGFDVQIRFSLLLE